MINSDIAVWRVDNCCMVDGQLMCSISIYAIDNLYANYRIFKITFSIILTFLVKTIFVCLLELEMDTTQCELHQIDDH